MITTTADVGLTPLGQFLTDALEGEKVPKAPPKEKGSFKPKIEKNSSLEWEHGLFGSLAVNVVDAGHGLTLYGRSETNSHAVITGGCAGKLSVTLSFGVTLQAGVRLIYAKGEDAFEVNQNEVPNLTVKIELVNGKAVHTRKKDEDNIDLIFLASDGRFVQLQVSVTTRNGVFWLNVQELWAGQVCRTTRAKAKQFGIETVPVRGFVEGFVAPLYARNACPGSDYLKTFKVIGSKLIAIAVNRNAVVPASECTFAIWEPDWSIEPIKGYQQAMVSFFNSVVGYGYATLKDGRAVFIHFRSFIDEKGDPFASRGRFAAPDPMTMISVRCKEGERGLQATAVRIS